MLRLTKYAGKYRTVSGKHCPTASLVNVLAEVQGAKKKYTAGSKTTINSIYENGETVENFDEDPVSWYLNLNQKSRYHLTNITVKKTQPKQTGRNYGNRSLWRKMQSNREFQDPTSERYVNEKDIDMLVDGIISGEIFDVNCYLFLKTQVDYKALELSPVEFPEHIEEFYQRFLKDIGAEIINTEKPSEELVERAFNPSQTRVYRKGAKKRKQKKKQKIAL